MKKNNFKKFMIVSDIHGDEMDWNACEAAWKFADEFDPEIRVINGDLFDFACLRQGAKDTKSEKGKDLLKDIECGYTFISKFFKKGSKYTNHFNRGNHDERLWELYATSQNALQVDYARFGISEIQKVLDQYKATMNPYHAKDGVFSIGNLKVVHGYSCGNNAAREHVNAYGNCVFGHTHSITSERSKSLREHIAYNSGCLCKLDMDYASKKLGSLKWQHGWGYGLLFPDGTFSYHQAVGINEKFVVAAEFKTIG